jgi:uncharacterized membrane protein YbhN (UPF0104 family)
MPKTQLLLPIDTKEVPPYVVAAGVPARSESGSDVPMKKRLLIAAKLAVSAALLMYVFHIIDVRVLMARFREVRLAFIVVAMIVMLFQSAISARKWQLLLRADRIMMSYWFLLRTYIIGTFISLFLPTSYGGDVYRVFAARGINRDLARTTSSVLFDRLTGLFALLSIACISYLALPLGPHDLPLFALYVGGVIAFIAMTSQRTIEWLCSIKIAFVTKATKVLRSFNTYRSSGGTLAHVLALSFLFQLNIVIINKVYSLGLGIEVPFSTLLVIIPVIYLTEMLPISINGLGVRESAFVFFFGLIGNTREEGLALSLLVISMRYVMGIVGGALLAMTIMQTGGLRTWRDSMSLRKEPEADAALR